MAQRGGQGSPDPGAFASGFRLTNHMKIFTSVVAALALVTPVLPQEARQLTSRVLLHNTVRIEAEKPDGTHVGTGFFLRFCLHKHKLVHSRSRYLLARRV